MKGHEQRSEHLCSVIPVDYTSYIIQFTVGKQKWEVRKRYSEFVKLYNLLESKFGFEAIDKLPEIPPKKFLLALSPSLIKERQNAFNEFLKEVVKNPGMLPPHTRCSAAHPSHLSEPNCQRFAKVPISSTLFKCRSTCPLLTLRASGRRRPSARTPTNRPLYICTKWAACSLATTQRGAHQFLLPYLLPYTQLATSP